MERISGVYIIRNTVNAKCYIGSSINIIKRWQTHRDRCRRKIHHSKYLERSWHKYGEDAFEFKIIEYVEPIKEKLEWVEQTLMYLYRPQYNVSQKTGRVEFTQEMRDNLSRKQSGANNFFYGKKRPEHSAYMRSDKCPSRGKHHTEEQKIKSSLHRTKINDENISRAFELLKSGMNKNFIAKELNVSSSCIIRLFANKIKGYANFDLNEIKEIEKLKNTSKLTPDLVREIRRLRNEEKVYVTVLARQFGLTDGHICQIANYKSWIHVK